MRIKNMAELEKLLAKKRETTQQEVIQLKNRQETETSTSQLLQARVIGLDVALRCTGWGIIDTRTRPFKQTAVDCGVIKNTPQIAISECLRHLAAATRELIGLYKPDIAVLEGGFYGQNVHTAVILGAARGAVISMLADAQIPVYEYAPRKVKQAVCGFGNASKEQVARLVAQFLNIQVESISLDSTDALAMALCHAQMLSTPDGVGKPI